VQARKGKEPKNLEFHENSVKNPVGFDKLATARLDQADVPPIDLYINRRRAMNLQFPRSTANSPRFAGCSTYLADLRPDLPIAIPRVKLQAGKNRRDRPRMKSMDRKRWYLAPGQK
jgi:hypothetical protein